MQGASSYLIFGDVVGPPHATDAPEAPLVRGIDFVVVCLVCAQASAAQCEIGMTQIL